MARNFAVLALALLAGVIAFAAAAPASESGPIPATDAKADPTVPAEAEPKEALKGAESAYYGYISPYYAYSPYYAPYYPKYYGYPYVYPHIYG